MSLGSQIKKYREKFGMTLEKLEEASGVPLGTIGALESRDSVRSKYAVDIARGFGLTLEQLLDESADYEMNEPPAVEHAPGGKDKPEENYVPWYPRPEWTEVGKWSNPEKWFHCNVPHSNDTFCLTVRDMSLYAPNNTTATIIKGDIVFIDPNADWQDGDFVFASSSHFKLASVKQYIIQGPQEYLFTPNPSWQQQWIKVDDTINIYGKVVSVFRSMK